MLSTLYSQSHSTGHQLRSRDIKQSTELYNQGSLGSSEAHNAIFVSIATKSITIGQLDDSKSQGEDRLIAYSDEDKADDKSNRKSTSGLVITLNGAVVKWLSQEQTCTALSSTEACTVIMLYEIGTHSSHAGGAWN